MTDAQSQTQVDYVPSATLEAFHNDDHAIRGVRGPVGCGKSSGMCTEAMFRAENQAPDKKRIRRTRGVAIRNTYQQLRQTTIKTWLHWMPMGRMSQSPDLVWRFKAPKGTLPDGTGIDMEVLFLSIDRPDDIRKLKSLEVTWALVNEASEILDKEIIDFIHSRTGRYPEKSTAPITWSGLWMDTNSMDEDHWWYRMAEVEKPSNCAFFAQPPALRRDSSGAWVVNETCENRTHQPKGDRYWLDLVEGKDEHWIKVNLLNEYGVTADGRPVYPEYSDQRHVAPKDIEPIPGLPLWLGFDFGHCAMVICQMTTYGRLNVLDEVVSNGTMGIRQFTRDACKPILNTRYAGMRIIARGDPAGSQRSQSDERTCFQELRAQGIMIEAAPTNNITARLESVRGFLLKRVHDGTQAKAPALFGGDKQQGNAEGFQLSPRCVLLRKGFIGKYYFKRVEVSGTARYRDEPEKNEASHPQDALGYVASSIDRPMIDRAGGTGVARPVEVNQSVVW